MAGQTTLRTRAPRPSVATRKAGYGIGAAVNALLLGAVNQWPGWDAVPFLTQDTTFVLGWVNASIVVALAANLLYAVADPPRLKALGDGLQNAVGLAALVRLWQVFPFAFAQGGFDWDLLARWVIGVGMFGSCVGIVVALVRLVRGRS
jgi:hypothetical protein